MKSFRNLMLGLLLTVSGAAMADDYAYLTVTQTGGESSYAVSSIEKITFEASDMVLHLTGGNTTKVPLAGLSKLFFTSSASGIATVSSNPSQISLRNGVLRVSGQKGSVVTVYDMSGKAVRTVTMQETETEINLSGVVKGIYIVKVGGEAKKVMNR